MKDVSAWVSFEGDAVYPLEMIGTLKHRAFRPVSRRLGICNLRTACQMGTRVRKGCCAPADQRLELVTLLDAGAALYIYLNFLKINYIYK